MAGSTRRIAKPALRSNASAGAERAPPTAMPIRTGTTTPSVPACNGRLNWIAIASANAGASASSTTGSRSTASVDRSSRATVSCGRTQAWMRVAASSVMASALPGP